MIQAEFITLSQEVAEAIDARQAVVALESTIISHGLPWPDNLACAQRLEAIVRKYGAVPATIALHDGKVLVGLNNDQLEALATAGPNVRKVSRRDLASILTQRSWGATTVAATMIAAHSVGIKVFATGGIGGVHRGAEQDFDISADLAELGRTPVVVVCAGAKSILDLPKTLEVLETQGVPIWGWQCDTFPSFFTRSSGIGIEDTFDTVKTLATCANTHLAMGGNGGALIVNPVPPADALDKSQETRWIEQALKDARSAGVAGKAATPFLLSKLVELSNGQTLRANLALVENNVQLASRVALEMAGQQ